MPSGIEIMYEISQVEAREVPEHLEVARERRLVEAVELLDLLDLLRVEVAATGRARPRAFAERPGAHFRHQLVHGTARDELDDDEREREDAQDRRDHQQQPFPDVAQHGVQFIAALPTE
jgi:hypothetical protein